MNYRGSYRRLLGNSKAAMMAAIEIYNKPAFSYRDECAVILLLNAWELFLKAILSKNGKSVFYPKKRKQPYRTLSWQDAFTKASKFFPPQISPLPTQRNLELVGTYRDNAVHFYNAPDFGVLVHALAQTSIKNFRDLLENAFGQRLETEINWRLMPIGIEPPIDVVTYIAGGGTTSKRSSAVRQFLAELASAKEELVAAGEDTGRLMTIFSVKLESVKKIGDADVVVGVGADTSEGGPLIVVRTQDPNKSHPLRQKAIVEKIKTLHGEKFTSYVFQAIVWKHDLKSRPQYCWQATEGVLTRYSHDVVAFVNSLSAADLRAALTDYRQHIKSISKKRSVA
jgi:hypothetical protein